MTGRVLGIIPARGGSKGVPRKNLRLLNGKPLLAYTAEAARSARHLSRVILSTDDLEIAEVGRNWGLEVPFLRAAELAGDAVPTLPVVQDVLRRLETAGDSFDAVCLLQPTSPLRRHEVIDDCIEMFDVLNADAVITVSPVPAEHNPHWVYFRLEDGSLRLSTGEDNPVSRRQSLPPAFHREGSVYVTRRDVIMRENSLYGRRVFGYPINPKETVNIDELKDLVQAEQLLAGAGMI